MVYDELVLRVLRGYCFDEMNSLLVRPLETSISFYTNYPAVLYMLVYIEVAIATSASMIVVLSLELCVPLCVCVFYRIILIIMAGMTPIRRQNAI